MGGEADHAALAFREEIWDASVRCLLHVSSAHAVDNNLKAEIISAKCEQRLESPPELLAPYSFARQLRPAACYKRIYTKRKGNQKNDSEVVLVVVKHINHRHGSEQIVNC